MRRCPGCLVDVEGRWERCPLCQGGLSGSATPSPLPTVPLRFSRRKVIRVLFLSSFVVIAFSFLIQLAFIRDASGIGVLRYIWLGIMTMWLVALMAIRQHRNVAKGTVYLIIVVGLLCAYWDYLTGWHGWSTTFVIPIMCAASIIALQVAVAVMHIEVGEHIIYTGLTVLLGLVPIVFLGLNWVSVPLPSALCAALSLAGLLILLRTRGPEVRHELSKRLHL